VGARPHTPTAGEFAIFTRFLEAANRWVPAVMRRYEDTGERLIDETIGN